MAAADNVQVFALLPQKAQKVTFGVDHLQVVDGHLQDLRFLQLGGALLLEGTGHEPLELGERGVDAISALLLDDASALLPGQHLAAVRIAGRRAPKNEHRA